MGSSFEKGQKAEDIACLFLEKKGYKLIKRRWKTSQGEIDLIMAKDSNLLFVEVKNRPSLSQGLFSLQPKQCQRIARAAEIFLQTQPADLWQTTQIDFIVVHSHSSIHHIKGIFNWESF